MKRWSEFAAEQPDMAEAGQTRFYQCRVGLGYLATVRKDGGPRVHPVCPVIAHGGLYVFIGNQSPKVYDLRRDGHFALHAFPHPAVDDEFSVSGRARRVDDPAIRQIVYTVYTATGAFTSHDTLFELWLERALHAKYGPRPSWPPVYTKWSSTAEKSSHLATQHGAAREAESCGVVMWSGGWSWGERLAGRDAKAQRGTNSQPNKGMQATAYSLRLAGLGSGFPPRLMPGVRLRSTGVARRYAPVQAAVIISKIAFAFPLRDPAFVGNDLRPGHR